MQIRKRITLTYVVLSVLSTLLLCLVVVVLFRKNNEYYFLKRLQDRAKIVASINFQNDPQKAAYYRRLKAEGLEELIDENDFTLAVKSDNSFEYNTELHLPPEFFKTVLTKGKSDYENGDNRYYYGQLFESSGQRYIVVVTAKDRRGHLTTLYMARIFLICGVAFLILAYFLGRVLAKRFVQPVKRIADEARSISASRLHNRIAMPKSTDEIAYLVTTFNEMLDRLEASFEIQANFLNNASHELKTPVTTIITESEIMLLKERSAEEYKEALEHIHAQASKLGNLTESLLKLTQTGYDSDQQIQDVVPIQDIMDDIMRGLDQTHPGHQVRVRNENPEEISKFLLPCNRALLELSLSNIISNAVKYSDNNVVFVTLSAGKRKIKISITDVGIGIPAEDLPHLYEPFFRGKKALRYQGCGLGLPLAIKIIRMHGGDLQVQSETDKGTVVHISFKRTEIKNFNTHS